MNEKKSAFLWKIVAAAGTLAVAAALYVGYMTFTVRPRYDPDAIAHAEAEMWKAYYTDDSPALAWHLVHLFRNQYGLNWWEAGSIGKNFARSAMAFRSGNTDPEQSVIPDLIEAYRVIQQSSGADFDPVKAARAELSWWVARRTPGQDSPKYVGKRIEYLYTVLYGQEHPAFEKAGRLRAQAAELRDQGGKNADWKRIEALLQESYRELMTAFGSTSTEI